MEGGKARGRDAQCVFQCGPGWGKGTLLAVFTNTATRQEQPWLDVTEWVDQGSITQEYALPANWPCSLAVLTRWFPRGDGVFGISRAGAQLVLKMPIVGHNPDAAM